MMSLDQKTLDFLVKWYQLPIQDILRVLASVDKADKQKDSYDEAVAAARLAGDGGSLQ